MWKYVKYTLVSIVALLIIGGFIGARKFKNYLFAERTNLMTYTAESKPIAFEWANDSIGNHYETQVAMVIPLKIEGLPHKFYMQFDTGSPYTYIYENDLNSLKELGLDFSVVVQDEARYVAKMDFELGGNKVNASMIKILENYGSTFNENDTTGRIKIGTVGSDIMENRITAIDFHKQHIQTYPQRPNWMTSLPSFQPFDFQGRRIMLPAVIDGKELELLYDSGCSAFGVITTKNRFNRYTDEKTELIEYGASSWGSSIPIRHKATDQKIQFGNTKLGMERASYVDMYAWTQRFVTPFTRIGGWLGNRPFAGSTLILDTKKEEFIIIESAQLDEAL